MKEKPILFSGPMVRSILEGRKTQTRRVIKPQPNDDIDDLHGGELRKRAPYKTECPVTGRSVGFGFQDDDDQFWHCPYGEPGTRLWVRETWCETDWKPGRTSLPVGPDGYIAAYKADYEGDSFPAPYPPKWKPSIHMPRWASRITLEITGVRVERLREISEADCFAEGIKPKTLSFHGHGEETASPIPDYRDLWESINGKGSWAKNPWVWVIEFKMVEVVTK